jgi:hypothetical protein
MPFLQRAQAVGFSVLALGVAGLGTVSPRPASPTQSKSSIRPAGAAIPLSVLWRDVVGLTDRMTTTLADERDLFQREGALFYIPLHPQPDSIPLWRLWDGWRDHMDSVYPDEGSFAMEQVLGYPWVAPAPLPQLGDTVVQLTPIERRFNISTGDHALSYPSEALSGYSRELLYVYGFHRYKQRATSFLTTTRTELNTFAPRVNSTLTVRSNRIAGGAVWEWIWNGIDFVDTADFGREVQSTLFWRDSTVGDGQQDLAAPTEAGDRRPCLRPDDIGACSLEDWLPQGLHGSPCIRADTARDVQTTRSIPLEWSPIAWGGDDNHPVLWRDYRVGKTIRLFFDGLWPVTRYTTYWWIPEDTGDATVIEIPAAYLRSCFRYIFKYDATVDELAGPFTPPLNDSPANDVACWDGQPGGLIASDNPCCCEGNAIGMYGVSWALGGTVGDMHVVGLDGNNVILLRATTGARRFRARDNPHLFNVYMVNGTPLQIAKLMHELYSRGHL